MHKFTERLNMSLRIQDLEVTLCERLLILKEKYKKAFNEDFYLFDKSIEKIEQENAIKVSINILADANLKRKGKILRILDVSSNLRNKTNTEVYT